MPASPSQPPDQVWAELQEASQKEVVNQVRRVVKEIIDEHFRISPAAAPQPARLDLCATVQPEPGCDKQGEPTHAVRVA